MRQPSSAGAWWRVGRRIRIRVEGLDESGRILLERAQRAERGEAQAARLLERYLEIERLHATDGRVTVAMEDRLRKDVRAWMKLAFHPPERKPLRPRKKRAKRKA